jgi:two-component system, cell cycle response regulator DivK
MLTGAAAAFVTFRQTHDRNERKAATRSYVMGERPIVLVAEDYEDARALFVQCLTEAGFEVHEAEDGVAAVGLARQCGAQAIVMDLHMPNLDGWEATRVIRTEVGRGPYILAVSAVDGPESRKRAFEAGCDGYVTKPIDPTVLCEILKTNLASRAAVPEEMPPQP